MHAVLEFGVRLIVALQGWGIWSVLPSKFLSFLGTEDFFIVTLPIIYWCLDSALGIRLVLILLLSSSVSDALKMAFHGPRPYWYSTRVNGLGNESSFGFPSGHAQDAVVVWGTLAAYLRKGWVWFVAILLMFLIGMSRLFLGVHFPHDVFFGWLVGALLLWIFISFWDPLVAWVKKQGMTRQVLGGFLLSLLMICLPLIPYIWLVVTNWAPPQAWASYATQAVSMQSSVSSAGIVFGLILGLAWLGRQGGFQIHGAWWKRTLRYLLGIAGVLAIRSALKFIFPEGVSFLAYFLRYFRYFLIGLWVTGAAPWLFIRLKLSERLV